MKVVLIHQTFVAPEEAGGTRHFELASHCEKQGIQFTIVASNLTYLTGKSVIENPGLITEEKRGPVRILRARTLATLHRSFFWRTLSFLSFMVTSVWAGLRAGPVDLVMGTSPPIFQALSAWVVALLRRRPFVFEVRDLWPEFAIDIGILKNPILIGIARLLERFLYWQSEHLMVNSPAYKKYLTKQKDVDANKVTLIPNGVNPQMFDPNACGEAFRREWDLEDKFLVVYAGAVGMANDIPNILRAARGLMSDEGIHVAIVGDGKELGKMKELAAELKVTNVTFTGAMPKSRMPEVLAASDVCLATLRDIPMFRAPYPNKVFDYMAAGRPTVLGIDGVIREVIEEAEAGIFVPPGDSGALSAAIQRLRQDPELCAAMGRAARDGVVRNFDRSVHARKFGELLYRLVPGRD
ncbi:MAG: putative glycosyltransferase EpsD [Verrucomicrobia subdivision 3 bacterium]|nr:putative glycosyltransferase EpsD [Limisphaerales bacterium]MCS1415826.1 putative glycosyltransferase EpsD [Limisphaerales bacterium]